MLPAGAVLLWGAAVIPAGHLLCNGQAVSRTTYSDLFSAIGTTFGSGDGSTTFNVPDLRDRFVIGKSSGKALGSTGGSSSITMTDATMPNHTHTIVAGGAHDGSLHGSIGTTPNAGGAVYFHAFGTYAGIGTTSYNHTHTIGSTGSGNAFTALPAYQIFNFLVKV